MLGHLGSIAQKENIIIEKEALEALATRANGGLRDALSLLDQISLLGSAGQAISTQDVLLLTGALPEDILNLICTHIFKREGQKVLVLLKELFISGREAHLIASELAKYMLNVAKAAYGEKQVGLSSAALADLVKLVDQAELIQMIEEVDRLEVSCRRSSQPIMNLEIGILSLCQRLDIAQWKNIELRLQKLENAFGLEGDSPVRVEKNLIKEKNPIITKLSGEQQIPLNGDVLSEEEDEPEQTDIMHSMVSEEADVIAEETDAKNELSKNEAKNNIDIAWQNILAELQRRHLPTFSLVSTHAFPIEITDKVITIGVFVENFQKMIENKVEYIKAAALACDFDKNFKVMIRVQAEGQATSSVQKKKEINDSDLVTGSMSKMPSIPLNMSDEGAVLAQTAGLKTNDEKQGQGAVKEAYRLFEGPGSRYIAPSQ